MTIPRLGPLDQFDIAMADLQAHAEYLRWVMAAEERLTCVHELAERFKAGGIWTL